MHHPRPWLVGLLAAGVALAGCLVEEESRDGADDANARHFTVDVPANATQVNVDVSGRATAGEPDVTVLIEDESGNNLATDTWSLSESPRRVTADVDGQARLVVTVRVVDGDAELDVKVSATVPDRSEPVVIVQERVVIVQVQQTTTTTTTQPTPTTTTSPPTPTPTTTTTPPPTNATNTTNSTNSSG